MRYEPSLMRRLQRPRHRVDVVLDTDAYNEIDDQFAIAYLLNAPEKVNLKAFYAAPFCNAKAASPADGMERSYQEILHLLKLAGREEMAAVTYRGATRYLPDEKTPVDSPAARHLSELAAHYTPEEPLYIIAIAAITNVASALLMNPSIKDKVVVIWLGGHARHWPHQREFNLRQDIAAGRLVFGSGAAVVQLACEGIVDQLRTSEPELRHWLHGKNDLCSYLCENTIAEAARYAAGKPWTRVIWDIAPVAWLLDTEGKMVQDYLISSPVFEYDHYLSADPRRHPISYVWNINRDAVFEDLFRRLTREVQQEAAE